MPEDKLRSAPQCDMCELTDVQIARPGGTDEMAPRLEDVVEGLLEQVQRLRAEVELMQASSVGVSHVAIGEVIDVTTLGECRVTVNGIPVVWKGRRSRQLFLLLAQHHPLPVNRDVLSEALWPGCDESAARSRLNAATHAARKQFKAAGAASEVIDLTDGMYRIDPAVDLSVDADGFAASIDRLLNGRQDLDDEGLAELVEVLDDYGGDYLPAELYEDWSHSRRHYLRLLYVSALDVVARVSMEGGDFLAVIDACSRITELDPAHEVAHRRLMVALARAGRASEALRQFELCKAALANELDVDPSEQTASVARSLRRGLMP